MSHLGRIRNRSWRFSMNIHNIKSIRYSKNFLQRKIKIPLFHRNSWLWQAVKSSSSFSFSLAAQSADTSLRKRSVAARENHSSRVSLRIIRLARTQRRAFLRCACMCIIPSRRVTQNRLRACNQLALSLLACGCSVSVFLCMCVCLRVFIYISRSLAHLSLQMMFPRLPGYTRGCVCVCVLPWWALLGAGLEFRSAFWRCRVLTMFLFALLLEGRARSQARISRLVLDVSTRFVKN